MTDAKKYVERSRIQVLYRYPPRRTVYHEASGQTEMVTALQMDPGLKAPPDIDPEQVKSRIRQDVSVFADADVRPEEVDNYTLKIIRPDYVYTFVHPAVWYCPNPKCRRLYVPKLNPRARREEQLEAIRSHLPQRLRCRGDGNQGTCGTRLRQYTWLTTHNCGDERVVPSDYRCNRHGDAYMHWYDQGSEKVRDWSITCNAPGCERDFDAYRSFLLHHTDCPLAGSLSEGNRRFGTAPIQKATHHMPRVINLLNGGNEHRGILHDPSDAARAAAGVLRDAASFAKYDPHAGFDDWRRNFNPGRQADTDLQGELEKWTRAKEATMTIPDEEVRNAALQPIKAKLAELAAAGEGVAYQDLMDLAEDEEYKRQIRDAAIFMDESHGYGLDRIEASAVDEKQAREIREAAGLLDALGIADVRYLESVPLTAVLTGFMRGSYDFNETSLRLYLEGGEMRVYANDGTTEAIWLQIDPSRTLGWLARTTGEAADVTGDFTQDLLELQKRYDSSARRAFARIDDSWTKQHTALLHTVSHVLVKAFGRHSGLELEGLSEEILPFANGILIYANQGGDFTLGGLQIVFEHHLRSVLAGLTDNAARCVYNPICDRDSSASCHGCVHLGEVSCSHFNKLLNRRHLVGRGGFWNL